MKPTIAAKVNSVMFKIDNVHRLCIISDEQGAPFCCGGPIPVEYASHYGGYGDDMDDAGESIHHV
jgi:hypothetical protein